MRCGLPRIRFIVTGGSSGIGRAIVDDLLRRDTAVWTIGRREPSRWAPPWSDTGAPHLLRHVGGDLRLAQSLMPSSFVGFDDPGAEMLGVVHCAVCYGHSRRHAFGGTTDDELDEILRVNLVAPLLLTRNLLPLLHRAPRATVAALSSDAALSASPGRCAYAASKAGLRAALMGLAAEVVGSSVEIALFTPTAQVDTPGIRMRRDAGFDAKGYLAPADVAVPIVSNLIEGGSLCSGAVIRS